MINAGNPGIFLVDKIAKPWEQMTGILCSQAMMSFQQKWVYRIKTSDKTSN